MWQTDQPSIDHGARLREAPVRRRPQDIEKEILTAGADFCGLMQLSRLSIGLALFWRQQAHDNPLNESPFFWLHHTDAFVKIAIASDRLRDLLIVSCTGASANKYRRTSNRHRLYVTPFQDAGQLLATRGLSDNRLAQPLTHLPDFASDIFSYIDRRNEIVHEVATRIARQVRDSVSELQKRYDHEQQHGFSPRLNNWAELLPLWRGRLEQLSREVDTAVNELQDWYLLLIRASNEVFQVEYWSRVLGPT